MFSLGKVADPARWTRWPPGAAFFPLCRSCRPHSITLCCRLFLRDFLSYFFAASLLVISGLGRGTFRTFDPFDRCFSKSHVARRPPIVASRYAFCFPRFHSLQRNNAPLSCLALSFLGFLTTSVHRLPASNHRTTPAPPSFPILCSLLGFVGCLVLCFRIRSLSFFFFFL